MREASPMVALIRPLTRKEPPGHNERALMTTAAAARQGSPKPCADTDMLLVYLGVCARGKTFHGWRGSLGVPSARTGERGALFLSRWSWQSAHRLRSLPSLNAVKSPRC